MSFNFSHWLVGVVGGQNYPCNNYDIKLIINSWLYETPFLGEMYSSSSVIVDVVNVWLYVNFLVTKVSSIVSIFVNFKDTVSLLYIQVIKWTDELLKRSEF